MKKLAKSFLLITVALTAILLSSCSQPAGSSSGSSSGIDAYLNAEPITIETLYGTWNSIYRNTDSSISDWVLLSQTFTSPNLFKGNRGDMYGTGTFTLNNDKLSITVTNGSYDDIYWEPLRLIESNDFKAIYKDNKLYLTPYATNDEIKNAYNQYGSYFASVEEFIKANCYAIYVKQ